MKKWRLAFYIFLLLFLIFNLATLSDYGATWDEAAGQHIGKVALDLFSGGAHDEKLLGGDLIFYGPFFEYLNLIFGKAFFESFNLSYVDAFHVLIVFSGALALWFLFQLASLIWKERVAFSSAVFLAFFPHFIAHSHYNPKEIPLLALFLGTSYFLYQAFILRKKKSIFWAGIILGMGMAVRADIILVLPIFFFPYLVSVFLEKKYSFPIFKEDLKNVGILILGSLAVTFLLWPTLWRHPEIFFESFIYFSHHGWNGQVLYFGNLYGGRDLPWHYAIFSVLASVPVVIEILFTLGAIILFLRLRKKESFPAMFLSLWLLVRIGVALLPGAVRYDGARHYFFSFSAFFVFSALGMDWIIEKFKNNFKIIALSAFLLLLSLLRENILGYPFGGSYFNEMVRAKYPENLDRKFDLEYWGASVRQGALWLNEKAEPNSSFCLPVASHLLQFYLFRQDLAFNCENPDYLMFFTRWAYLPGNLDEIFHFSSREPVFRLSVPGGDILYIFRLK